jgi:nucleoside-diphosphate kinase
MGMIFYNLSILPNDQERDCPMERTLVLLKPDCIERRLIGRVIARFEDKSFDIVAMQWMRITPELAKRHYAEHVKKDWYPDLEQFITSGPVVAMVIEGPEAVRVVREMAGVTNGLNAAFGTIRGDFCASYRKNLVHSSDSPESAQREIEIFFPVGKT